VKRLGQRFESARQLSFRADLQVKRRDHYLESEPPYCNPVAPEHSRRSACSRNFDNRYFLASPGIWVGADARLKGSRNERSLCASWLSPRTSTSRANCAAVREWIERWRPEMEEDAALEQYAKKRARIRATLSAERDRSVPVMDVKAVEGRSVGRCP
jgi:hypothetical protein